MGTRWRVNEPNTPLVVVKIIMRYSWNIHVSLRITQRVCLPEFLVNNNWMEGNSPPHFGLGLVL